uniref:Uncharacterized protein n=1 Tax=viral metagenome TaxID=1070528 RepID=A0A6M3IIZ4_9ZZZZ
MPDDKKAVKGDTPSPEAVSGDSQPPDDEMSNLVADEVKEQVEGVVTPETPAEPEEINVQSQQNDLPIENVLAKQERVINKLYERLDLLENRLNTQPQPAQQQTQPQSARSLLGAGKKPGDLIAKEMEEKIEKGELSWERPYELFAYLTNRADELSSQRLERKSQFNTAQGQSAMRATKKAQSLGYNLQNGNDPMTVAVRNELARNASTMGMNYQEYLEAVPFAVEHAVNVIAEQIQPANKTAVKRELNNVILPTSDIPTAGKKVVEKQPQPSDIDKALSKRYGSKFETVSKIQGKVANQKTFEVSVPIELD